MIELVQGDYSIIDVDYRKVVPIQGDFKTLNLEEEQKLLKSYQDMAIFKPALTVWIDESGDVPVLNLIDGHQSQSLFEKNKVKIDGGYNVKALKIDAKSLEDAKRKLLIINSEYGEKDVNGFFNFTQDMDLDWVKQHASFKIEKMDMSTMVFDFKQRVFQGSKANNDFLGFEPNEKPVENITISSLQKSNAAIIDNEPPKVQADGQPSPPIIQQREEVSEIVTKKDQKSTEIGKATEDEFTMFQRVMKVDDYKRWIDVLNHVRSNYLQAPENDLSNAMVYIMNEFKQFKGIE